jgi:tetratricopeptide (TPR) repeat protein
MKKISFSIVLIMLINLVGKAQDPMAAQTNLLNYAPVENKLKKSNEDIQDPKKNIKAKTWVTRGTLMTEIYNFHNQYLRKGMPQTEVKLFFKEPKEVKTYEEGSDVMEEYIYDRITLTFRNKSLETWKETVKLFDTPLQESRMSFDKAISFDTDGKEAKSIKEGLAVLKLAYETEAVFAYNDKNYTEAYNNFAKILEVNKLPLMGNLQDTVVIYNTARAAYEMKDYEKAVQLFSEVKNLGLDEPYLYVFLKNSYMGMGDTLKGEATLDEGFRKYPNDESILIELINYYLVTQQSDKALDLLSIAEKNDPTNVSFIFAEGTIRDKMGNFEEAKSTYLRCLEIDPAYYNAAFNLGVLHYNKAVKMYDELVNISDNQEYEKARVNADDMFKSAIPYMEKAHEIDPATREPLETLKTLYLRLQMTDKLNEVNKMLQEMP